MITDSALIVEAKTRRPTVRAAAPHRRRVSELILSRLEGAEVLWVTATAGSGKTTSVVHALEEYHDSVAWLRLDETDASPGRFLLYLEHTLGKAVPDWSAMVESALKRGISHAECAALLAQAAGDAKFVLVIDDLERIEGSAAACDILSAFIRYASPASRTVLISRRDVDLGQGTSIVDGRAAYIGEADLAFSVPEAREALERLSLTAADAKTAVAATGGWVTGVLFESWRSAEHVHGAGGEADSLNSYLSSEIMASIDPVLCGFLVATAILDVVTIESAGRLGFANASAILGQLRSAHLPILFESPHVMRCHARFREYLLERWSELGASVRAELRLRHGQLLAEAGRHEDAVAEFLEAGDIPQAEDAAEQTVIAVARRLDFDLIEQWLGSFRAWRVEGSPTLTAASLLLALDREEFGGAASAADRLVAAHDPQFLAGTRLFGAMAWAYFVNGRIADAFRVLDDAPDDAHTRAIRFCIGVELIDDETHYRDRPPEPHTELDGLLARVDLAHGRYQEALTHLDGPQEAVRLARVGALTALGRLEEAWDLLSQHTAGWTGTRMRAELLAESARPEDAWSELIRGRDLLSRSESPLYRIFALLTETALALRFRRDVDQARAALRAVSQEPTAMRRIRVLEQLALWHGLIGLIVDDDAEAVRCLREAVELMQAWDRRLFLPTAAVYLAEAEWRAGNEDESDHAADLALEIARRTGSVHSLSRALSDFPSVLSRRLDVEADPDGPWHDLGRTLLVNAGSPARNFATPTVVVEELGHPALLVGGRRTGTKLIKTVELLSYLASEGPVVNRTQLIAALFDSKNDKSANAYLRMAVNGLRQLIDDVELVICDSTQVRWNGGRLTSAYVETLASYRRMRVVTGAERLRLALTVLKIVDGREVLPGARSSWVAGHRQHWAELICDIKHTAAEAAYETADYGLAHELTQQVLAHDPYRERAWRLAMKIASAVGDNDRVIAAYRACEAALREVPAQPSPSTRTLLDQLRPLPFEHRRLGRQAQAARWQGFDDGLSLARQPTSQ
jgi:DNA-binding SARP family transcriptional activator